ncbi:MAG: hypothetical protein ACRDO7_02210 [Nocardioidaceae bacterium]
MNEDPPLQKADFGAIYNQADPRAYFQTLAPYDYVIPQYGAEAFARLLREHIAPGRRATVLDVCCSYGVVGTLLRTDLGIGDLYEHYRSPATADLTTEQLTEVDRRLLLDHAVPSAPRVVGLDVAPNAVDYAVSVGAMDSGVTDNLEVTAPSRELADLLRDVDLITTTGGVGYVTERTFEHLLQSCPSSAWVAAFCLRTYDYGPIAATMDKHGLRTERVARTFRQRRFTDDSEQRWATSRVVERGLDPEGKESTGYYHADLYLSRPETDVGAPSADRLLADLL